MERMEMNRYYAGKSKIILWPDLRYPFFGKLSDKTSRERKTEYPQLFKINAAKHIAHDIFISISYNFFVSFWVYIHSATSNGRRCIYIVL